MIPPTQQEVSGFACQKKKIEIKSIVSYIVYPIYPQIIKLFTLDTTQIIAPQILLTVSQDVLSHICIPIFLLGLDSQNNLGLLLTVPIPRFHPLKF